MIKTFKYIFYYNVVLFCNNTSFDSGIINNEVNNNIIIPVDEVNDNIIPVDEIVLNNETIKPITGNKNLFLRVFLIFVVIIVVIFVVVLFNHFKEINKKKEIQLTQAAKDFIEELKKKVNGIKEMMKNSYFYILSEEKKSQLTIKHKKDSHCFSHYEEIFKYDNHSDSNYYDKEGIPCEYSYLYYDKEGIPCEYNYLIGFYYEYVDSNGKNQYCDKNFYPFYMVNMDNFTNTKIYYDEKNKIIYDKNFKKTDEYYIYFNFIEKKNHNKISTSYAQQENKLSESFQTKLKDKAKEIEELVYKYQNIDNINNKPTPVKDKDIGDYYKYQDKNNLDRYCDTSFYPFFYYTNCFKKYVKIYYDEENNTIYIYNKNSQLEETDRYQLYFRFYKFYKKKFLFILEKKRFVISF
jgi:hypothetical protein